ncbi:hypothetical protein GPJ56_004320 [Histomonas meleagridis]|uniref:uncharacterized protein n=1 Tax=Histomonas meleagridis TaxID=135588 RepID=UPI003559D957|nr:hypothetical protein GPJ56_004320 [Histomonas meleagridis]KAH0800465.1 hypothetical protein GO595_006668 [Histomonas meleagridis]
MLCLTFLKNIPNYSGIQLSNEITLKEFSNGICYGIIASSLKGVVFNFDDPIITFENVLKILNDIGYKPQEPCSPLQLYNGDQISHLNLCYVIEFVVEEKSITTENLLQNIRRIPRSFFVLRCYPKDVEDAFRIWFSKFPCIYGIPDLEDIEKDIPKGIHIAAVFSRCYPTRIPKTSISKSTNLTSEEVNSNWNLIKPILEDFGAFVPTHFPISSHLLLCFLADIFYIAQQTAHKFVKIEQQTNLSITPRINETKLPIPKLNVPQIPSPCQMAQPQTSKVYRKKSFKPVPKKQKLIRSSSTNAVDDEAEMLRLYEYISRGERSELFITVSDIIPLLKALIKLMNGSEYQQKFSNLQELLNHEPESIELFSNGLSFLTILSGNNNPYAASRKIVYFARRMMESKPNPNVNFSSVMTQTISPFNDLVIVRDFSLIHHEKRKNQKTDCESIGIQTELFNILKMGVPLKKIQKSKSEINVSPLKKMKVKN